MTGGGKWNREQSRSHRPHHSHRDREERYRPLSGKWEGRQDYRPGGERERGTTYHYGDDRHHTGRPHSVKDRLSYRDRVIAKYSREGHVTVKREQHRDSDSDDSDDPRVRHRPKKIKVEKEESEKSQPSHKTWSHTSSNSAQASTSLAKNHEKIESRLGNLMI